MMNKLVFIIPILLVIIGGFFFFNSRQSIPSPVVDSNTSEQSDTETFSTPKKAAHYESNTPEHGATLAGVPVNVVINFNFDLANGSEISIIKEGNPSAGSGLRDYGAEKTVIDEGKLAMRRKMNPISPDGLYTVNYKACWADGSCHDGNFQFKIDKSKAGEFKDLRNQAQVTIDLKNFQFNPPKVRISKGAKVTWTNQDSVIHTVNTDSHPAHTYYLNQNSRDLNKGDKYEVVFDVPGIYPYHCTPHATTMKGSILVE